MKVVKITVILAGVTALLAGLVFGTWSYVRNRQLRGEKAEGCYLTHSMKRNDKLEKADLAVFEYDTGMEGPYLTVVGAEGTRLMADTAEGTRLSGGAVYEGEPVTRDMRIHKYTCIKLTERMKKGDYIDIRISFANGADFVLLSKKQIQEIQLPEAEGNSESILWLNVSEEEILRLSSAVVDAFLNDGCSIYAVQYIQEGQEAAVINYKVNDVVSQLIEDDPNIVKRAENVLEWELWNELKGEGNALSLEEVPLQKEENELDTDTPAEPGEDEIIYFD